MPGASARVYQVHPSDVEDKLNQYFPYCCSSSCCENVTLHNEGNMQEGYRRQRSGYLGSFGSPQTWTAVMVGILALLMLVQNISNVRKRRRILPLLRAESSGSVFSTQVTQAR